MRRLRHQRDVAVWVSPASPADGYSSPLARRRRTGRVRRLLRIGTQPMVLGLIGVVGFTQSRPRLLTGLLLTALPVILRDSMLGPGLPGDVAALLVRSANPNHLAAPWCLPS
jgi:hypothetical protein